jgi:hypothetical protein
MVGLSLEGTYLITDSGYSLLIEGEPRWRIQSNESGFTFKDLKPVETGAFAEFDGASLRTS